MTSNFINELNRIEQKLSEHPEYHKLYGIKLLKIFASYRIKRALRFLASEIKCCSESRPAATEQPAASVQFRRE